MSLAEEKTKVELQMITGVIANDLSYILCDVGRELIFITYLLKQKKVQFSDFKSIFNEFFKKHSNIMNLWFMDKYGIMKYTVPDKYKAQIGNDYSFRNYFKKARKNREIVYSGVLRNARIKGIELPYDSINVVVPFLGTANQFSGVVGGEIHVERIETRIQTDILPGLPTQTGLFLVDTKNRKLIIGSNERKKFSSAFKNFIVELSKAPLSKEKNITTMDFNGKKYFLSKKSIKNQYYAFELVGVFPYDETMAYLPSFYVQSRWLLVFVVIIISLALVMVIYNEIIRKKLQRKIEILEININEKEKKQAVTNVIDSEYFQRLESKIKNIMKNKDSMK
jgi:hypothetical protein